MLYIGYYGTRVKNLMKMQSLGSVADNFFVFLTTKPYYHTVEIDFFPETLLVPIIVVPLSSRILVFKHENYQQDEMNFQIARFYLSMFVKLKNNTLI